MSFFTSESTAKLDKALAQAHGEFTSALKQSTNPHFRSKYADLASVFEACKAPLTKYNITVTQWPVHSDDGRAWLLTRVAHEGEWMQSTFSMPVSKQDPHGYKSAVTYLKRTCLEAALGIATDEDDDGNAASHGPIRTPGTIVPKFTEPMEIKPEIKKHLPLSKDGRVHVTDLVDASEKAKEESDNKEIMKNLANMPEEMKELSEWLFPIKGPSQGKPLGQIPIIVLTQIYKHLFEKVPKTQIEKVTLKQVSQFLEFITGTKHDG